MKRILIVEVNWLGDVLLTTPIFKAIKKAYPNSYLGVCVAGNLSGLLEDNPYVDEIIEFDERTTHRSLFKKIGFVVNLRRKKFDKVFLVHRSWTRAFICKLSGIKESIGYKRRKTKFLLTQEVEVSSHLHRMDRYLALFSLLNINIEDKNTQFFVNSELVRWADDFLLQFSAYKGFIGLHPGANWDLKKWPLDYFVQLGDEFMKEGFMVFISGTAKELALADNIYQKMKHKPYVLSGKTSLKQMAALLNRFNLFVSADTGVMHLAAAVGCRTISIFGPTSWGLTGPRGLNQHDVLFKDISCQRPCYNLKCQDNFCMRQITPFEVFNKAKNILGIK